MKSAETRFRLSPPDRAGSSRRAGLTLLELAVAFTLLTLITGGALFLAARSQTHIADEVRRLGLDDTATRVLQRISAELVDCHPTSVLPVILEGSETIRYQKVLGYSGGAVELGPENELRFELAPEETRNGADDDGNGLADDGVLVHIAGAEEVTIAANLLLLEFTATTSGISFAVEVGGRDEGGRLVTRRFTREVSFRNSP